MKTSKDEMEKYLRKIQQIQRTILGVDICFSVDTSVIDGQVVINVVVHKFYEDHSEIRDSKYVHLAEWKDKEANDKWLKEIKEFLIKWDAL